jgi:hypothetical protein
MHGRLFIAAHRASGRIHPHLLPGLLSMKPRAMVGYGDDDGVVNNGFGGVPCTSGRAVCCTWRAIRCRRTSAHPEDGA